MTHAPIKNNNYLTFYKKKTTRITSKKKKKTLGETNCNFLKKLPISFVPLFPFST